MQQCGDVVPTTMTGVLQLKHPCCCCATVHAPLLLQYTAGWLQPRLILTSLCSPTLLNRSMFTGYAGRWRTWEVGPQASDSTKPKPAAANDADHPPSLRLIDDSTNLRLWRFKDPSAQLLQQTNLYQNPERRAAPSTRFGPYLKGNTTAGRADGYGTTTWTFGPDSSIVDVSAAHGTAHGTTHVCVQQLLTATLCNTHACRVMWDPASTTGPLAAALGPGQHCTVQLAAQTCIHALTSQRCCSTHISPIVLSEIRICAFIWQNHWSPCCP